MKRTKPIHIKTAHTYFYTARIYGLLVKANKNKKNWLYRTSSTCNYLCGVYNDENNIEEYQRALKSLLLNNDEKGELYSDFLNFVKRPKKISEIYNKYKTLTGKTLIAWCLEANLIRKKSNIVSYKHEQDIKPPSLEKFWKSLVTSYIDMQDTGMFGVKKIYADLAELKLRISCELGIDEDEDFDRYLKNIIQSKYGTIITLDGGPPLLYKEQYHFRYKDKNYLYLSIKHPKDVVFESN